MNNQEILDSAPEGATHIGSEGDYYKQPKGRGGYWGMYKGSWGRLSALLDDARSLVDIERITELEEAMNTLVQAVLDNRSKQVTIKTLQVVRDAIDKFDLRRTHKKEQDND